MQGEDIAERAEHVKKDKKIKYAKTIYDALSQILAPEKKPRDAVRVVLDRLDENSLDPRSHEAIWQCWKLSHANYEGVFENWTQTMDARVSGETKTRFQTLAKSFNAKAEKHVSSVMLAIHHARNDGDFQSFFPLKRKFRNDATVFKEYQGFIGCMASAQRAMAGVNVTIDRDIDEGNSSSGSDLDPETEELLDSLEALDRLKKENYAAHREMRKEYRKHFGVVVDKYLSDAKNKKNVRLADAWLLENEKPGVAKLFNDAKKKAKEKHQIDWEAALRPASHAMGSRPTMETYIAALRDVYDHPELLEAKKPLFNAPLNDREQISKLQEDLIQHDERNGEQLYDVFQRMKSGLVSSHSGMVSDAGRVSYREPVPPQSSMLSDTSEMSRGGESSVLQKRRDREDEDTPGRPAKSSKLGQRLGGMSLEYAHPDQIGDPIRGASDIQSLEAEHQQHAENTRSTAPWNSWDVDAIYGHYMGSMKEHGLSIEKHLREKLTHPAPSDMQRLHLLCFENAAMDYKKVYKKERGEIPNSTAPSAHTKTEDWFSKTSSLSGMQQESLDAPPPMRMKIEDILDEKPDEKPTEHKHISTRPKGVMDLLTSDTTRPSGIMNLLGDSTSQLEMPSSSVDPRSRAGSSHRQSDPRNPGAPPPQRPRTGNEEHGFRPR